MDLVLSNDFSQLSASDEMLVEGGVDWDGVGMTVSGGAGMYIGAKVGAEIGGAVGGVAGGLAGAAIGAIIYSAFD
ncbi:MAG: hypothetical protein K5769_05690 [Pseudobutyrivibrio sp.]|nr:hypothetical protein [Pseudobutyrivibrio sp.]